MVEFGRVDFVGVLLFSAVTVNTPVNVVVLLLSECTTHEVMQIITIHDSTQN